MAMKKQEDPPKGSPEWMTTFSDLMNLLLCFFVLLFSMSSVDNQKFQEVAASIASSFSILNDGSTSIGDGVLVSSGISQLNELSIYYNNLGLNSEGETEELKDAYEQVQQGMVSESENMADKISDKLHDSNIDGQVEVISSSQYVALNLKSGVLFDSGKANLKKESRDLLDSVSDILKSYEGYTIEIIGHTDNLPTNKALFENNMVLSFYRAYSVYEYLTVEKHLSKSNLKSVGRGEEEPIASNETAEGRSQNRRVEIRIYNKLSGV